jgi:hypothetical protein
VILKAMRAGFRGEVEVGEWSASDFSKVTLLIFDREFWEAHVPSSKLKIESSSRRS